MSTEGSEAERGGDLPNGEVDGEYARCRRGGNTGNHGACAFLEAGALEQADHRQHEPDDGDVAAFGECLAECRHDFDWAEATGESSGQAGNGDDEQRIQSRREADDDDDDADEGEHVGNIRCLLGIG